MEEEMHHANERYEACLARVEQERASLDEKLAQRDAEITKLSAMLEELKASAETQVTAKKFREKKCGGLRTLFARSNSRYRSQ